jgi:TetR/AcrR family transcriptional regulator, transcriptional repressor for nem operon
MAQTQHRGDTDTSTRILDIAERLVQTHGFNGFSYANIASELKISKASLHYHFATKAELGDALIRRYVARFGDALVAIDERDGDAPTRLEAYANIYADVLRDGRMCLCGMLAAEYETLPTPMRDALIGYFDDSEAWLTQVLERGQQEGTLQLRGSATDIAQTIVSSLEGALLIARPYGDVARFEAAASRLLTSLDT